MTREKLLKFSLITFAIGLCLSVITYLFFHFVTDGGITMTWQSEAGKPFLTYLVGQLAVLFIFASAVSAISSFVFFGKEREK